MKIAFSPSIHFYRSGELCPDDLRQWWKIYKQNHYVRKPEFFRRIRTFDKVLLIKHPKTGKVIGGSGVKIGTHDLECGKTAITIYIAQAYIKKKYRGCQLLPIAYTKLVIKLKFQHPFRQIWVWMDALSYKPYLIFANNLKTYYPSLNYPTSKVAMELGQSLGQMYYPGLFDADSWIIRKTERRLAKSIGRISDSDLENPHIAYYSYLNPGHVNGQGLLCLFPGSVGNIFYFVRKMIIKTLIHFGKKLVKKDFKKRYAN